MAERSFRREVEKLRAGAGEEFRGEGILAVTKALLQSGISYVGGYQGAPISHLMDVLRDGEDILNELGVHFEASASEATAAAMLAASVNYPLRGAVTWKSTVGTNVASDALANIASGGVTGGALVIVGEDYGEGSSIMQERSHAFAMKSQMWLLDPRPNLVSIVDAVEKGFQLSEASNTPVMLELRVRACHVYGRFTARDNVRPAFTLANAMENPVRDANRIVLPPANYLHEQEKIRDRWPAAVEFVRRHKLNEMFGDAGGGQQAGIIVQGGLYNTLIRALGMLGLADRFGKTQMPIYVLNVTYPLISDEVEAFCRGKSSVLMIEEGQPEFIEQAINTILRRAGIDTHITGKGPLPMAGEYTSQVLADGLRAWLGERAPALLGNGAPPRTVPAIEMTELPPRPAGFCTGCPERPVFTAIRLLERELGRFHVSCDIGCHLFSILPPFNIGNTTMGYGLGWAGASAFNARAGKRTISIMGDGGFWHNGLTSGVGNAVFNDTDNVLVIVDNGYSAATGGQDIPSSRPGADVRSTGHSIAEAVKGVGVNWVRTVHTYDLHDMYAALKTALTTPETGPKVIVAQAECQLNRQRRIRPLVRTAIEKGERFVKERFYVDAETCTGDHACVRLSGCPSLTIRDNPDPLKTDPVSYVDNSCVGCGHCGAVAHEAVLCPSFTRVDLIFNPGIWDRIMAGLRRSIVDRLRRRAERRRQRRIEAWRAA